MFLKLMSIINVVLLSVSGNIILQSPMITNNGLWGAWQRCPFGTYAQAVQLRTEPFQGLLGDDTAANAIRLYCGNPNDPITPFITSSAAEWGQWGNAQSCRSDGRPLSPDGYITGFQLRVEPDLASGDDTATNNLRVFCTYPNTTISPDMKELDGLAFGVWSAAQYCNPYQAICALQTQVEEYQGNNDDTALNNIAMECCDQ